LTGTAIAEAACCSNRSEHMDRSSELLLSTLVTGSVASAVSTIALGAIAKIEGKSSYRPTNSTSHWLHGHKADRDKRVDLAHTAVGYATHHASALFWAAAIRSVAGKLASHPPRSSIGLLGDAAVMSAIAGVVDYGIVPKRLTPGWELTLSKKSVVAAFASLAIGLAAGAMASREATAVLRMNAKNG
jgi:hypothetical protein